MAGFRAAAIYMAVVGAVGATPCFAGSWRSGPVFNGAGEDVVSVALHEASNGTLYYFAQFLHYDEDARTTTGVPELYYKKSGPNGLISGIHELWEDGSGASRLADDELFLLSVASESASRIFLSGKTSSWPDDPVPTVDHLRVWRGPPWGLTDVQPKRIDSRGGLGRRKASSIDYDAASADTFACWTTVDDRPWGEVEFVSCRGKSGVGLAWQDSIFLLDPTQVLNEDHSSVRVINDDGVIKRVVAYHSEVLGLKVRVLSTNEPMEPYSPDDVLIGKPSDNWPYLIDDGQTLHLVSFNTATRTMSYSTCDFSVSNCADVSSWSLEELNLPEVSPFAQARHPEVAVDSYGRVFIAFELADAVMPVEKDFRVAVTAKCDSGWATPQYVNNSTKQQDLGGISKAKSKPSFILATRGDSDPNNDTLSLVYIESDAPSVLSAERAERSVDQAYEDLCPTPHGGIATSPY